MKKPVRIKQRKINDEPMVIDPERYNYSVTSILSWYRDHNINIDIQKDWIKAAADKLGLQERELINRVPDGWIIDTAAYVSRMYTNEVNLKEINVEFLIREIKKLIERGRVSQEKIENRIAPIYKVKENAQTHIDIIFERIIDNSDFDIIDYINATNLSIAYVRQISKSLEDKKYSDYLIKANSWIEKNKTERKPRTKKIKSAEDICKLFVCCPEWESIKSIDPEKILGSECVVTYHTVKKRLAFLYGNNLAIHRSMIVGFDTNKSKEFHCSDKNILINLTKNGKININKIRKDFDKASAFDVTGRVTDKIIVLGRY